jgi:hypothetical protein
MESRVTPGAFRMYAGGGVSHVISTHIIELLQGPIGQAICSQSHGWQCGPRGLLPTAPKHA